MTLLHLSCLLDQAVLPSPQVSAQHDWWVFCKTHFAKPQLPVRLPPHQLINPVEHLGEFFRV